ncbi:MAG: PilZ domain-containing protein [Myxococcaceae bacterium]
MPLERMVQVRPVGSGAQPQRLVVGDLSRGGMFIRTAEPFDAGTRLDVSFEVRGRALPFAEVEVAWRRSRAGFGVKFTALAPKAQALVDHLVFLCGPRQELPDGPRKEYRVPPGLKSRRGQR